MRDVILWRVIWKEYRLQRAFWLAIAGGAVAIMLFVLAANSLNYRENPTYALFAIALGLPVVYALGSGAILFAGEREAETYDFQRALPVTAGRVLAGKLAYAVVSAVVMMPVVWLAAWALAGELPEPTDHVQLWAGSLLALFEVFAWAMLFSLALHRVLWAVVLGAAAASAVGFLAIPRVLILLWQDLHRAANEYSATMPLRAAVLAIVLAVDIWLGRRWLREASLWRRPTARDRADGAGTEELPAAGAGWGTVAARLLWQAWRQMWGTLAAILGAGAILAGALIAVNLWETHAHREVLIIPLMLTPLVTTMIGACLFWGDQRREMYQYFAERGVSPRWVWFSRQAVGIAALLAWLAVACVGIGIDSLREHGQFAVTQIRGDAALGDFYAYGISRMAVEVLFNVLGLAVLGYCTGQACSLVMRSGVVGLFLGLLASFGVCMWAALMTVQRVPLWFSVVPIPIVLLWASWWRAPHWISTKTTWRARLRLAGSVAIPCGAIFVAVACFRVYEIPVVDPRLPLDKHLQPPTAEELATANMYSEAWLLLRTADDRDPLAPGGGASTPGPSPESMLPADSPFAVQQREQAARREAAIRKFIQASQRGPCRFSTSNQINGSWGVAVQPGLAAGWDIVPSPNLLADEVLRTCDPLESQGRLDEAGRRYEAVLGFVRHLHQHADYVRQFCTDAIEAKVLERLTVWAVAPGQTGDRVRAMLRRLEEVHFAWSPDRISSVVDEYLWCRAWLDFEPAAWKSRGDERQRLFSKTWATLLPWEHARLRRLLNAAWADPLRKDLEICQEIVAGRRSIQDLPRDFGGARNNELLAGTLLQYASYFGLCSDFALKAETRRRAARLQLALIAWRLEHGRLPERLDLLVGPLLDKVPIDVYTDRAFGYRPDGAPYPVLRTVRALHRLEQPGAVFPEDALAAGTPFVWSAGPYLCYRAFRNWRDSPRPPSFADFVYVAPGDRQRQLPESEEQLWSHGWAFPIPAADSATPTPRDQDGQPPASAR